MRQITHFEELSFYSGGNFKNKSSSQNRLIFNVAMRVQCPECNADMRKDAKHSNAQGIKYIGVLCVFNEGCIYMLPKSQRGIRYPLHVKELFYGENLLK